MSDLPEGTEPDEPAPADPAPAAEPAPEPLPQARAEAAPAPRPSPAPDYPETEKQTFRRRVIGWGAVAAVASAMLAGLANLGEIIRWFQPDDTRQLVEQTRSTIEDTDAKVNELVTLLRNQAAASGVSLDIESEEAIRNAVQAIVVSGNKQKQAALDLLATGDVAGAAERMQQLAESQSSAASTTNTTAADSWRETGGLYDAINVLKAMHAYGEAVRYEPDNAELVDLLGHAQERAGRLDLAEATFHRVLALEPDARTHASTLLGLGRIAKQRGNYPVAAAFIDEAHGIATQNGLRAERIYALRARGILQRSMGEVDAAVATLNEARTLAIESGDQRARANVLTALGTIAASKDQYDAAELSLYKANSIYKEQNDLSGQAVVIGNLGAVALKRGDLDEAEKLLLESVALGERLDWQTSIAYDLINLAVISSEKRDFAQADERLARAQQIAEESGLSEIVPVIVFNRGETAQAAGDLESACRYWVEGVGMLVDMGSEHVTEARTKLANCASEVATD